MNVGVPFIALWAFIVVGCAGNEIVPAASAAPAPGDSDPVAALYAAPADVAFITVSDISADIVGPDDVPFDATFLGYRYATASVTPFDGAAPGHGYAEMAAHKRFQVALPSVAAGPETVVPPANDAGWDTLSPPPDAK